MLRFLAVREFFVLGQTFNNILFLKCALVVTGADIVAIPKHCTEVCEEVDRIGSKITDSECYASSIFISDGPVYFCSRSSGIHAMILAASSIWSLCSVLRCGLYTGRSILNTKLGSLMTSERKMRTMWRRSIMMLTKENRKTITDIKVENQQISRPFSGATMMTISV